MEISELQRNKLNELSGLFHMFEIKTREIMKEKDLVYLIWTQYTPYFSDGEPCNFSSGFAYGFNEYKGIKVPLMVMNRVVIGFKNNDRYPSEIKADMRYDMICGEGSPVNVNPILSDDDMLRLFGDHVLVEVALIDDKLHINVEEWDHE